MIQIMFDSNEMSKQEQDAEKEALKYILFEFIKNIKDPLGCEPACRDESSPGCEYCIKQALDEMFNKNKIDIDLFGIDWVQKFKIIKMDWNKVV